MPKVLLVSSITHNGLEYLPGLHQIDDATHSIWKEDCAHALSPISVEAVGKVVKAPDADAAKEEAEAETKAKGRRK